MTSTQSYKDFLLELDKYRNKVIYARITSLRFDESPRESIEGRVTQGSINLDGASALRRSCSLTIVAENFLYDDYLWGMNTKFKLEIGVENPINPRYPSIIWFNQGIYLISSFNTSRSATNFTITIQGKDKMCLLNGEVGGSLTSSVDFGQIEEEDENGNWVIKKIPIPEIIRNMVHVYANEPYHNIVINDLDTYGLELLEYRYDTPMYLYRTIDPNTGEMSNTYTGALLETADKKYYLSNVNNNTTNPAISLGEIPVDHLDMLVDTLVGTSDPKPVYVKENGSFKMLYMAKVEYGQTAGYRQTDLIYAGDLIANIGESITSVLDKIKNMLVEFEYFYDINGQFIFQKKQAFISTMWGPNTTIMVTNIDIMTKAISLFDLNMTAEQLIDYEKQSEILWGTYDNQLKEDIITFEEFCGLKPEQRYNYLTSLLEKYEMLYYSSGLANQPIEQLAIASSTVYTFNGGELVTAFNNNPQINNLKNDYSIWGERTGVSGAKVPVHLRYAIDEKPTYYKAFDGKIYMSDRNVIEELKQKAKDQIRTEFYDKIAAFKILYPIPAALGAPKKLEDGSWSAGWWDIRDWFNYYTILNGENPSYTMKWYSSNDLSGCVKALSLPITYKNPQYINESSYVWLLIRDSAGTYNSQHGRGNPAGNATTCTLYHSYYTNDEQTEYKTEKVKDENGNYITKSFIPPYNGCNDNHTYIEFLEGDVKRDGNTVYFYNPAFPSYDNYEDLVFDKIEKEYEEYEKLGILNYVDWREIIYQMARDYYKHNTEDAFEYTIAQNNPQYYKTGRTGYESYYIDIQGFWRDLYYPHLGDDYSALGVEDKDGHFIDGELSTLEAKIKTLTEYIYGKEVDYSDNNLGGMENDICALNNLLSDEKWEEARATANSYSYDIDAKDENNKTDPVLYLTMLQDLYFRKKSELEVLTMTYDDKKAKYDKLKQDYTENYYTQVTDSDARKHWNKNVFEAPETLNFWFDFLEASTDAALGKYSVQNIGARTKPVNDTNVKSIYFRETPGVVFVEDITETVGGTGYRYIQVPNIDTMFTISAQGKSAKERLDELLYQHSYSVESATITTVPIYYLQPNTRVYLYDEATKLNGDYIISKITIPLAYNGTMQLTATKAAENII